MEKQTDSKKTFLKRLCLTLACLMIVSGGVAGMTKMLSEKKTPAKKQKRPVALHVETMPVVKVDVNLVITGFGEARPLDTVHISPEVAGRINELTLLKEGETIEKGSLLFAIDSTDYDIALTQAKIQVELMHNQLEQLKVSYQKDKDRLSGTKQNTRLARTNWERLKSLYENDRVGTLSTVESAEQSYHSLLDTQKKLITSIALYPLQIGEAESSLADARSNLENAERNVERCVVKAPFTARIKEMSVEKGSYVSIGALAVTLADDSILEIEVPLSDKDAFGLLSRKEAEKNANLQSRLKDIVCRVETVTGDHKTTMGGSVHRVVKYDPQTRTLTLAVRVPVPGGQEPGPGHLIPLMDGMFCKVAFTGKRVQNAVRVPATLLNPDSTIYLARDGKLRTEPVIKVLDDADHVYVTGGVTLEDEIIVTPLSCPIENQVLSITGTSHAGRSERVALARGDVQ